MEGGREVVRGVREGRGMEGGKKGGGREESERWREGKGSEAQEREEGRGRE